MAAHNCVAIFLIEVAGRSGVLPLSWEVFSAFGGGMVVIFRMW